jgi:hypothetical protein
MFSLKKVQNTKKEQNLKKAEKRKEIKRKTLEILLHDA